MQLKPTKQGSFSVTIKSLGEAQRSEWRSGICGPTWDGDCVASRASRNRGDWNCQPEREILVLKKGPPNTTLPTSAREQIPVLQVFRDKPGGDFIPFLVQMTGDTPKIQITGTPFPKCFAIPSPMLKTSIPFDRRSSIKADRSNCCAFDTREDHWSKGT